jgi:hypothetical protein
VANSLPTLRHAKDQPDQVSLRLIDFAPTEMPPIY